MMREIVFHVLSDTPGYLHAEACVVPTLQIIRITATSLEELQHEARDAVIKHLGNLWATSPQRGSKLAICSE